MLAPDGTCAQCIGRGRIASYKDRQDAAQSYTQTTPVGGGNSDYGRSFDGKTCIDNMANGNSNCLVYQSDGSTCSVCDQNYLLV
jgi:hypothetical protein